MLTSLAIMAAVMVSGFLNFWDQFLGENVIARDLAMLGETARTLQDRTGRYPATIEELATEARQLGLEPFCQRWGEKTPILDWFDQPYSYEVAGERITIRTLGADGRPGGSGIDADFEWPFPRAEWIHKIEVFARSEWFWRSLLVAALSGIPPALLWCFKEWRGSTAGEGPALSRRLLKACGIALVATIVGMVILFHHYAGSHH